MGDITHKNYPYDKAWPLVLLCFVFSVALVIIAASTSGVYPFGDTAFVTWDEKYQYYDFFAWLKRVMVGEASLFYTSATGLGSNAWGLFSYYLSSPFNVLLVFFDADHIEDFLFITTTLKIGCAGSAMAFFISRRFRCSPAFVIVLSLGWACSSWTMSQCSNIMWLDVLYILPFILWGSHELVRVGRWRMFTFAMAAAIISCWYMGYVVALFAILWTICELYLAHIDSPLTLRTFMKFALRYAGYMVLALVLSAFTLIPSALHMLSSDDGLKSHSIFERIITELAKLHLPSSEFFVEAVLVAVAIVIVVVSVILLNKRISKKIRFVVFVVFACVLTVASIVVAYCKIDSLALGFLPYGYDLWKSPQFYAGCLAFILCIAFMFDSEIPIKERFASGIFIWLLILSCINSLTYCVWCGLRVPGGFFCRVSFLPVVLMLCMAARTCENGKLKMRPWWHIGVGSIVLIVLVVFAFARGKLTLIIAVLCLLTVAIESLLLLLLSRTKKKNAFQAVSVLLGLLAFCELAATGTVIWQTTHDSSYTHASQSEYCQTVGQAIDDTRAADPSCYRIEKTFTRADLTSLSESMAFGYNALSSYSSAHNGRALALLEALGYGDQDMFTTEYTSPNKLTDSLFGVKYVLSLDSLTEMQKKSQSCTNLGTFTVYENPTVLPLAYLVDKGASNARVLNMRNPLEQQNAFVSALTGEQTEVYKRVDASQATVANQAVTYSISVPAGKNLYCYVQAEAVDDSKDAVSISIDGKATQKDGYAYRHGVSLISTAHSTESTHTVALTTIGELKDGASCLFYIADPAEIDNTLSSLAKGGANVIDFSNGYFSLSCNASQDGTLMVTIPNDDGWKVSVNGQHVETLSAYDGALMLIPVNAGENHVEAVFTPPGLYAGIAISLIGLGVLAFMLLRTRRQLH